MHTKDCIIMPIKRKSIQYRGYWVEADEKLYNELALYYCQKNAGRLVSGANTV